VAALFCDNPTVNASAAQLSALARSHRAWMRNLHVAGDAAFRIAFRLQAPLYEAVVANALEKVAESKGIERRGLVLSMLMQLKQICNHPVQYLHQADSSDVDVAELVGRSGKLARLTEMLEEVVSVGDRALVFTQFAEMGHLLRAASRICLGELFSWSSLTLDLEETS